MFRFKTALAALVIVLLAGFTTVPVAGPAAMEGTQSYVADKAHSHVGFKVRHLGISNVRGNFNDYDFTIQMDGTDLSTIQASATVRTASVDTDNERRDGHLRSPDFFASEEYETMTFVSKEVRNIDGSTFELVGDLTIRGITQEVVLDAEFLGLGSMGETQKVGFEAETVINRKAFNLEWDRLTEAGGLVVGHDVTIQLEIEANQQ